MIVCLIIYGLFSILGITSTQLRTVSFFKVKEDGKKRKYPERGDWDINGEGGRVIELLLNKGIDIYSGEGVINFLVGHFEKGSSDYSRKIINDHTIFVLLELNNC